MSKPKQSSKKNFKWIVEESFSGIRLDKFIATQSESLSREKVRDFIIKGAVRINKHTVNTPSESVKQGDSVILDTQIKSDIIFGQSWRKNFKIRLVYMDEHYIVIEKESGIPSVPSHYKDRANAVHYLKSLMKKKYPAKMPIVFIVHRLDKDTSGLMLFARHLEAQRELKEMIADKKIERKYLGIALGKMEINAGKMEDKLGPTDNRKEYKQEISDEFEAKTAITHYTVRKKLQNASLVEFSLETGRTHQIRIQMHERGHSLMGDEKYKATKGANLFGMPRLALHAYLLKVPHPHKKRTLTFEAPLPKVLTEYISKH